VPVAEDEVLRYGLPRSYQLLDVFFGPHDDVLLVFAQVVWKVAAYPAAVGRPAVRKGGGQVGMDPAEQALAQAAVEEAGRSIRLGYNTGYTLKRLCLNL